MAYCTDIEKAKAFATARHAGVVDKAGEPYTGHLERVASRLLDHPEAAVVAWLHDTAEDTGVSLETIAALFGSDTAEAVDAVTHREGEDYMDYVRRAGRHPIGRLVKISDLIDNSNLGRLKTVTAKDVARQRKYTDALTLLVTD